MQIDDGTEPQQDDISPLGNGVIADHDCIDYAKINCKCNPGECEQRFRNGSLGNHDLEQFDSEALEFFILFVETGSKSLKYVTPEDLEDLHALRIMLHNAKNVVAKRELTDRN